jgi:hypothetical protein
MKDEGLGLCTRQVSKGNSYISWAIALLMTLILSNPVNQGNLSKYWPRACKQLWTHGKANYGLQEEHWSQKSHVGTLFDSDGIMDSGPMSNEDTPTSISVRNHAGVIVELENIWR